MKCGAVLVLLLVTAAPADAAKRPAGAPFTLPEGVPPIRLTLHPAAAPVPALRYRLLPELRDVKTGNAVLRYYRAFAPEWQSYRQPEMSKALDAWVVDTRKAPPKELAWVRTAAALKEIDLGARSSCVDWEMLDGLRQEGFYMLLGDIQSFRLFANLLAARARLEAIDRDFDRGVYTLQTGYKLGRDVGQGPVLIQALVGIAITGQMFVQTEELIQTPGSPNLYWALTELPRPFVPLQGAYQGERLMIDNLFPGAREVLADRKARPLSDRQVQVIADKLARNGHDLGIGGGSDWEMRLGMAAMAARAYPEAKRVLLAQGRSKEEVESISPLQAFLLLEVHNYDRFYDDMMKWVGLPYPVARQGLRQAENQLKQAKAGGSAGTLLATLLLPAAVKVQDAAARTDRRVAALRVIEALRLYAAGHDDKLPATLDEVKEVPVPADPVTGNPFLYRVDEDRATLFAPAPPGDQPHAGNVLMYELTLRRR